MSLQRNLSRILPALILLALPLHAADQHWLRVSSDHFIVLTDAGDKSGHDVAAHLEQMRVIFGQLLSRNKLRMSEPMEVIAIRNDQNYAQIAPLVNGQPITAPGFWLSGEDRIFIVLNLFEPDSWRAVDHEFAHYMLNYNYPPTPPWFDEGFAEYFASLNLTAKNAEFGSDPELHPGFETGPLGNQIDSKNLKSFTEILSNPVWLAWPDLLAMKNRVANGQEGTHHTLFYAQSWILVHYLLNKDKMSELGKYFGLVEIQKAPVDQAIQQAFGTVNQLDHEVKEYFHSLKTLFVALDASKQANAPQVPQAVYQTPLPFTVADVATSSKQVSIPEAQALVDEMELRILERRQQAFDQLEKLISDPKTETVVAHRALAWAYVQRGDTAKAFEELNSAVQMSANDPWTRFGLALASYHSGENGARVQGLANMMESLHIVIDEYPDFAEAYNMLGWARLTGGGGNAALESMKQAVQLSPRNEEYQLRLARAYLAAKKFDDATSTLERLKLSQNPRIAQAAAKDLTDLPFLKKYGVPPEEAAASAKQSSVAPNQGSARDFGKEDDSDEEQKSATSEATTTIDKRPVKFLKATLVSVDCSSAPAAVVSVSRAGKVLKFRTADYKSLAVIGAPDFSCKWKGIAVNLNYRAGGKTDGDLVSVEIPEAGR